MVEATCSADSCDRPAGARGMCSRHYAQWRRAGGTGRKCSVDGCSGTHFGRGWCEMHYDRWRASGDPLATSRIRGNDAARLDAYTDRSAGPEGCWPWLGTITHEGYGVVEFEGRQWKAHRLAYIGAGHDLADDLTIDHICHTVSADCHLADLCPHRRCVNPAHLEPVPAEVNVGRGTRRRPLKTHCKHGHLYDEKNTYESTSGRTCRACHAESEARRRSGARPAP